MENNYPDAAGFQNVDTSIQAASDITKTKRAAYLQGKVIGCLMLYGNMTTEEIATMCKEPYASIQPRTSELKAKGLIEDSGARKKNASGKSAVVWRFVSEDEGVLQRD